MLADYADTIAHHFSRQKVQEQAVAYEPCYVERLAARRRQYEFRHRLDARWR